MTQADDLKAGNPGLSDEAAQFGLMRAWQIFLRYESNGWLGDDVALILPRRWLTEIQLAAIIAGAYEDGVSAEVNACDDAAERLYEQLKETI